MTVLVLDGCGHEGDDTPRAEPASSATDTTEASSPASSPAQTRSTLSSARAVRELTDFAATEEAWLSAHEHAEGYTKGAAFGPLVERDGQTFPRYGGVLLETPVVIYSTNLPDGTTLGEAKRAVLDEFPPGARFDIFDDDERGA